MYFVCPASQFLSGVRFLHCSFWLRASPRHLSFLCQAGLFLAAAANPARASTPAPEQMRQPANQPPRETLSTNHVGEQSANQSASLQV